MAIMEISSRGFRENQRAIFDLADKGERIIIRRGKKRSYTLTPVEEGDIEERLSPALIERIERGLQNIREGKTVRYTPEELRVKMGL